MKKGFRISDGLLMFIPLVFYFAGAFFIHRADVEKLKKMGVAEQEEYTYYDSEGDEQEDETLISIIGIGDVLVYENIYFASIPLFFIAMIIGMVVYRDMDSKHELEHVVFANCILGLLLIRLSLPKNIIPTILFWLGIISAYIGLGVIDNREKERIENSKKIM